MEQSRRNKKNFFESELCHQDCKDEEVRAPLLDKSLSTDWPSNKPEILSAVNQQTSGSEAASSTGSKPRKQVKYLCGLAVKKDTSIWNLIVMPTVPFITCTINFFSSAFMPLLLSSPDYYDIPKNDLGKATSVTIIWSQVLPLLLTPFITFVYETIGRRIPLSFAMVATNLLIWLMPKVAPNF